MRYSSGFLRFCKQATLQFCFVKPIVAIITIILKADNKYSEGNWEPSKGYLYQTIVYNFSISLALYALILFYYATRDLLKPYDPVLKFITVKFIIFLSFWQGVFLSVAQYFNMFGRHGNGAFAKGIQNFLICMEMAIAALMLHRSFPVTPYCQSGEPKLPTRAPSAGGLRQKEKIVKNFTDTLNPTDVISDIRRSFDPRYKPYVQHPNTDEEGKELCIVEDQQGLGNGRTSGSKSPARSPTIAPDYLAASFRAPRANGDHRAVYDQQHSHPGECVEEDEDDVTLVFDRKSEQSSLLAGR
eukprot:scpid64365/ scgid10844/ Transmembrane protein 184A